MHTRPRVLLLWSALVVAASAAPAAADVLTVPGDYATVQAAIDAAQTGDTVLVGRGSWNENVVISGKTGITLRGRRGAELRDTEGLPALTIRDASDVRVEGLGVTGAAAGVLAVRATRLVLTRIVARDCGTEGIWIDGCDDVLVERCSVVASGEEGLRVLGTESEQVSTSVRVLRCQFSRTDGDAIDIVDGDGVLVERCVVRDCIDDSVDVARASRDVSFVRCTIVAGDDGFQIDAEGTLVSRCKVIACGEDAFDLNGEGIVVERSIAIRPASDGFDLTAASAEPPFPGNCRIERCRVASPGEDGVNARTAGNTFERVKVSRAGQAGFRFTPDAVGNTVTRCVARGSGGLDLDDANETGANTFVDSRF